MDGFQYTWYDGKGTFGIAWKHFWLSKLEGAIDIERVEAKTSYSRQGSSLVKNRPSQNVDGVEVENPTPDWGPEQRLCIRTSWGRF